MTLAPRQQVILIAFSTVLAAFSLFSIITFTDPYQASFVTHGFFYISLFLTALGLLTLIGLGIRELFDRRLFVVNLSNSFRQALLVSILIVISFSLLAKGLLFWWVELSLILFLLFVEIFINLKV